MSDLLQRDMFVVSQKPKFIELTNEYRILDEAGEEIGAIRQEGQTKARKVLRFLTSVDQFLTHRLAVYDREGAKVLELVRPAKFLKSTLQVTGPDGGLLGKIVQENVVGRKRFRLEGPAGEVLGSIEGESWVSWDFALRDAEGTEVGRVTKQWAGILREGFTTADHYLVKISPSVSPELRPLLVAAGAGVDLALKQDDTGGMGFGGLDLGV